MKVLLSRPDRVGDVVLSTALIPALRATAGVSGVVFLGREIMRSLIAPVVDGFVAVESATAGEELRALGLDASLHLNPHWGAARLAREAGIGRRVGYRAEAAEMTDIVDDPRPRGEMHEAEASFQLAGRLGLALPAGPRRPVIFVERRAGVLPENGETLAIHVGASPGKARLPEALMRAVARAWLRRAGASVLWLGAEYEGGIAERLAAGLEAGRTHNWCGRLALPELAAAASGATVFLGRDSGPAHLAAAAGGNVVVVFPAARADMGVVRWRPLGDRVRVVECEGRARWWEKTERASARLLARLAPETVVAAIEAATTGC